MLLERVDVADELFIDEHLRVIPPPEVFEHICPRDASQFGRSRAIASYALLMSAWALAISSAERTLPLRSGVEPSGLDGVDAQPMTAIIPTR